ncbi:MAG: imidazoleglycerol-phosphate dehydratase HisB [Elusimicrobiota bacterium]
MKKRQAKVTRNTKETKINIELSLDGQGDYRIKTGIPFLDHMFSLFAKHSLFDLKIIAEGDQEVDDHHLVEDIGITLGEALKQALGNKLGINRYGFALVPMDEVLSEVVVDLSGRAYFHYGLQVTLLGHDKEFDYTLLEHFFRSFAASGELNLQINLRSGSKDNHHIFESVFKGLAKALTMAVSINHRVKSIPSTKGKL